MKDQVTMADIVERAAKKYKKKTAIFYEGKEITYKDFHRHVCRMANGLRSLGIEKGDVVAMMLPNVPEFLYTYFGIQRLGAVAVTSNPMYKGGEITHILNDSGARILVTLTNFVPLINEIRPEVPGLEQVIVTGERAISFGDPHSTAFVQMVYDRKDFPDIDEAYRRTGALLVEVFEKLGVEGVWYKHMGGVRVGGRKIAGFLFSEIEDVVMMTASCMLAELKTEEFFKVAWVPPEVKDKVLEPLISVEELTGRRPSNDEFRDAVVAAFEKAFEFTVEPGTLDRDEKFGYEKQRALAYRK